MNGMSYTDFIQFILGPDSPVLKQKVARPTKTPLYKVVTDLQFCRQIDNAEWELGVTYQYNLSLSKEEAAAANYYDY